MVRQLPNRAGNPRHLYLQIRTIVRRDGERLPILVGADGIPLFSPTVFTVSELRARNLAVNSIRSCLRAIAHLELFCAMHVIDVQTRLDEGSLFGLAEVDALVQACRTTTVALKQQLEQARRDSDFPMSRVARIRGPNGGIRKSNPADLVRPKVAQTRLRSIMRYLDWLVRDRLSSPIVCPGLRGRLEAARNQTLADIKARLPGGINWHRQAVREGLSHEATSRLLEVTHPDSPVNPWTNAHTRGRNSLIIRWLLILGLRRGELLGVRVPDIDFGKGRVTITRRPHNANDPRKEQPQVKTRGREIGVIPELIHLTRSYVMDCRRHEGSAYQHDYLFVASRSGTPMSLAAMGKVFEKLRTQCSDLSGISAHVLRHTWNDRFSEQMDESNISVDREHKIRSYLMGWAETSGTAAEYTRRHTRKAAMAASLALQSALIQSSSNG